MLNKCSPLHLLLSSFNSMEIMVFDNLKDFILRVIWGQVLLLQLILGLFPPILFHSHCSVQFCFLFGSILVLCIS